MQVVRPRDRAATEAAIVAATEMLLARDGFAALSVQSVAAAAGVDRKLVYRYFGGVEGVVEAIGGRLETWLGGVLPGVEAGASYARRMRGLMAGYMVALRGNAMLRQMLAWEVAGPSPLLARLEASRSAAFQARLGDLRGDAGPPLNIDAAAVNATILAAIHYLVLRDASTGRFAGLALDEAGWGRIAAVVDAMLAAAYGEAGDTAIAPPPGRPP